MPYLRHPPARRISPELLAGASPEEAAENLRDLARLNRWLGGHWLLRQLVSELARRDEPLRVLDVGAASGDMAAALRNRFPLAQIVSLDVAPHHLAEAPAPRVAADAFRLPFPSKSFDVVTACLFLHHFEDDQAVVLLRGFAETARKGVVILDAYRHGFARAFVPATRCLFGWHRIMRSDAPVSVEASFRPAELAALAQAAGLRQFRARAHFPWFRTSLVARTGHDSLTL